MSNAPPPSTTNSTAATLMNALQTKHTSTSAGGGSSSSSSSHRSGDRHHNHMHSKHSHHTTTTTATTTTTHTQHSSNHSTHSKHQTSLSTLAGNTINNNCEDQPRRKHDVDRIRKKFRDAIYVGNFERVARIIKNIIENDTLDLSSVLLPYASRHVTPIGLAARRGHVKICKILVEVLKDYVVKQHAHPHSHNGRVEDEQKAQRENGEVLHMLLPPPPPPPRKEDEEYTFDHEVEDNANEDESSSEQHNNTNNASISPQPYTQPAAALLCNNGENIMLTQKLQTVVSKNVAQAVRKASQDETNVVEAGDVQQQQQSAKSIIAGRD